MYIFVILFSSIFYLVMRIKKNTHVLQQNFYNENNRYFNWGKNNLSLVFDYDALLVLFNFLNIFVKSYYLIFINLLYLVLFIIRKKELDKEQVKLPLKITSRVKRLLLILLYIC